MSKGVERPERIGSPPSAPDDGPVAAECTECRHAIRADARTCPACGARQWSKAQAALLAMTSAPIWPVSLGAIEALTVAESAFVQGFLIGCALIAPGVVLVGIGKYRERCESLRAGGGA